MNNLKAEVGIFIKVQGRILGIKLKLIKLCGAELSLEKVFIHFFISGRQNEITGLGLGTFKLFLAVSLMVNFNR